MRAACLVLLLLCTAAHATDIHVPGDWPSIQSAVTHAQDGDTILVEPGLYPGAVQVLGKAVRIVGVQGAGVTTLDGGDSGNALILFGLSGTAEVEGLTIVGGTASRVALPLGKAALRRCRVLGGAGVGIVVDGSGSRTIEDCLVSGNAGGGVRSAVPGTAEVVLVQRCAIERNGGPDVDFGGGLYGTAIAAADCVVSANIAQRGGGGAFLRSQQGTVFSGNTATVSGGGYYAKGLGADNDVTIKGATVTGNHAPLCGGIHLDATTFFTPAYAVHHCLVADNTDDGGNVGFLAEPFTTTGPTATTVLHSTFANNRVVGDETLIVLQSILRGPAPVMTTGGNLVVQYSDIEGFWPGTGNFDADPLFVDAPHGVYALTPDSPCVDADSPFAPHDPDGSIADIGVATLAPLVSAGAPHFGVLGLPALGGTGSLQGGTLVTLTLSRARPLAGATLVLGIPGVFAPFKSGVFVPVPIYVISGLPVDAAGTLTMGGIWPAGMPSGLTAWAQFWIADAAADLGFAASNGLGFVAP